MTTPLLDLQVLVTRPLAQSGPLSDLITGQGAKVWVFPTLEIQPTSDLSSLKAAVKQLSDYDIVIFITANVVNIVAPYWPSHPSVKQIAMGAATARAMTQHQLRVDGLPTSQFSSEGLLSISLLENIAGKKILLLTGEDGRQLLKAELTRKGAHITEIPVYRRVCPTASLESVAPFWESTQPKIMISTSVASLENLWHLAGDRIFQIPLCVVSERIRLNASEMGPFTEIVVTTEVSDSAILDAVIAWYSSSHH
jgi:uroporphyrinogen-III synthase